MKGSAGEAVLEHATSLLGPLKFGKCNFPGGPWPREIL